MQEHPFKADLSLIRDEVMPGFEKKPTGITSYRRGDKELHYVNAYHEPNAPHNVTCETVRHGIETFKPQIVIVESLSTSEGRSPPRFIAKGIPDAKGNVQSEGAYAAALICERGEDFIGGEPSSDDIIKHVKKAGYTTQEMMAIRVLSQIPRWNKEFGELSHEEFAEKITKMLFRPQGIPQDEALTPEGFFKWYDEHALNGKSYSDITEEDIVPSVRPDANYFQKLFHTVVRAREHHLDELIAEQCNMYDRVMVVFGGGHEHISAPVFEQMFGQEGQLTQPVAGADFDEQRKYERFQYEPPPQPVLLPADRTDRSPQALAGRGRGKTTEFGIQH